MDDKPGLIGREDVLIKTLAKKMLDAAKTSHDYTSLRSTDDRRGYSFEVLIRVSGSLTGHVARVTVELDRVTDLKDEG